MSFDVESNDFGFVGQAYVAPDPFQDSQICMNYYPEISQSKTSKTVIALLGTPGLLQVASCIPIPVIPVGDFLVTDSGNFLVTNNGVYLVYV